MKKITLIALCCLSIYPPVVYAGAATGGATEVTQILNNIELVQQVITTKEQLETMITNLKKLQDFVNNGAGLIDALKELNNIVQYGQALAYNAANLSSEFNNRFKDFEQFASKISADGGKYDLQYSKDRYQKWARQNLDNVHSALRAANLQSKYFQSDAQTIKEIERKAQTAQGRDQLLQAGIEIAAQQAQQMVQLRQLITSDMQMQANYQASLVDRQAEKDAIKAEALREYDAKDPNPNGYTKRWY